MSNKSQTAILKTSARILLALAFIFGQSAWAGQNRFPQNPAGADKAQTQQTQITEPRVVAAKAHVADAEAAPVQNSPKVDTSNLGGNREGIKVHGHWTIEVHNPDGSLVRHVEFENALDPGFQFPIQGQAPIPLPGGAAYLSAVLSGQAAAPSGHWAILLVGPSGLSNLISTNNAPCVLQESPIFIGACVISQSGLTQNGAPSDVFCGPPGNMATFPGLSCNLAASSAGTVTQLSGSVVATQSGQVSTVATLVSVVCGNSVNINAASCFLPVANSLFFGGLDSVTSSNSFSGTPISVSAGQTIAVTVNISFS